MRFRPRHGGKGLAAPHGLFREGKGGERRGGFGTVRVIDTGSYRFSIAEKRDRRKMPESEFGKNGSPSAEQSLRRAAPPQRNTPRRSPSAEASFTETADRSSRGDRSSDDGRNRFTRTLCTEEQPPESRTAVPVCLSTSFRSSKDRRIPSDLSFSASESDPGDYGAGRDQAQADDGVVLDAAAAGARENQSV